jgi:hypothetical protein
MPEDVPFVATLVAVVLVAICLRLSLGPVDIADYVAWW